MIEIVENESLNRDEFLQTDRIPSIKPYQQLNGVVVNLML